MQTLHFTLCGAYVGLQPLWFGSYSWAMKFITNQTVPRSLLLFWSMTATMAVTSSFLCVFTVHVTFEHLQMNSLCAVALLWRKWTLKQDCFVPKYQSRVRLLTVSCDEIAAQQTLMFLLDTSHSRYCFFSCLFRFVVWLCDVTQLLLECLYHVNHSQFILRLYLLSCLMLCAIFFNGLSKILHDVQQKMTIHLQTEMQ